MSARAKLILILLVCLGARLVNVDMPLAGVHGWRQCDTAAVARNFAEEGMDIRYPRVDWREDGPGFVEMEFPLFSWAAAAVYRAIGVQEWVGRVLAAIGGVLTAWYLYRLVARTTDEPTAAWAALIFSILPLNVYYGQAFMPESWMLAASAAGVYHFFGWTQRGRWADFAASAASVALACLLKLPALYLGLPLLWLALRASGRRGMAAFRGLVDPRLWVFGGLVLAAVGAWYWHAHVIGSATRLSFGIWNSDKFADWRTAAGWRYWYGIFIERLAERYLTWPGTVLCLLGLLIPRRNDLERLFDVWTAAILVYFVIVSRGNEIHEYYQFPLMLPAAFYCGRAFEHGWAARKWLWAPFLAGILGLSIGRLVEYRRLGLEQATLLRAASDAIKSHGLSCGRLVTVTGKLPSDPSLLYFSHAKGWAVPPRALTRPALDDLARRGASSVCGIRASFNRPEDVAWLRELVVEWDVIQDDDRAVIVGLERGRGGEGAEVPRSRSQRHDVR